MKVIAQRELRNRSGEVLRRAERGEQVAISVGGRPVAVLGPYRKGQWVSRAEYLRELDRGRPGSQARKKEGGTDATFFDDIADLGRATLDLDRQWRR